MNKSTAIFAKSTNPSDFKIYIEIKLNIQDFKQLTD